MAEVIKSSQQFNNEMPPENIVIETNGKIDITSRSDSHENDGDDTALSSLLLLLKSTTKPKDTVNIFFILFLYYYYY